MADITPENIITHPSVSRNKLIAETLQRLRYVQRSGQGVDIIYKSLITYGKPYPNYTVYKDAIKLTLYSANESEAFVKFVSELQDKRITSFTLAELMILRYLYENKNISLSKATQLTQLSNDDVRQSLYILESEKLIESSGRSYMLTPRVYDALKSDVNYIQDKTVTYLKAKDLILEYLSIHDSIDNETIRDLCRCTKSQATKFAIKMRKTGYILMVGKGRATKYIKNI